NVSRDEQRHIGFGVKVLSELLGEGRPGAEENRAAVVELLREVLPYGPAVFSPPNLDREYTECYGFSLEDIFAFGLKLIRQRWRTIGYPTEEMPPGVFPFDPNKDEREIAESQIKLMMAGILGPPDGPAPDPSPEMQRLYFDVISRVANPKAANGSPLVYQWHFSDADPWHLTIDNGSTRAEPGEAPSPNLTIESSWADWVASGKPDANQLKMVLQRRIRPRGSIRELARMRKVFPS
ncbi:MAG: ribonucleoside-diphosphate reductase beta chain, partial [Solirubrobacterales bacterium]|nr:ribonucleoside-diphosphate reductase beta chain [Solirubrobacterales bacterium]